MSPSKNATQQATSPSGRPLRVDARKNIAAILDAATACLATDPDASVGQIAKAAGVARVTLYAHFDSRATLLEAVVDRAMKDTDAALAAVDLDGDPVAALHRFVQATWGVVRRYGALVTAAERSMPGSQVAAAHAEPRARVVPLLERGQQSGAFRDDLPVSWLVTILHSVTHAAANAVHDGELSADEAPGAIIATMLGATTPPGSVVPDAPTQ